MPVFVNSENGNREAIFLRAEWRFLAMLNYEIEPSVLSPFVPAGTELDSWNGRTYVSMVGFMFLKTRVRGVIIPFHQNFEEVNLRFYVRRKASEGWRRGVVFIKELVPRAAIAFIARKVYNENYIALPMSHRIEQVQHNVIHSVAYAWRFAGRENWMRVETQGTAQPIADGSLQEFITEHYWGYVAQRDGSTMEYRVEHPRWRVWDALTARLKCDVAGLYGEPFQAYLGCSPASAFLADGSEVTVNAGTKL
jgi:uncharacterized protein YqjF (DUF2071 family)